MTESFRAYVRDWLREHAATAAAAFRDDVPELTSARRFQRELHRAGLAGIDWPAEYGGRGLDTGHRRIFDEEAGRHRLPTEPFAIGLSMVGPTLLDLGTPRQRSRYLPPLLGGDEIWCQLLSEPGAGSDLAAVSCTAAAVDSGGFRVNGHKIWSSRAQWADFGVLLARTPEPGQTRRHRQLSLIIVDMHADGVTVRPLRDMAGREVFNEVFLDDVAVPAGQVIGELRGGWAATMSMLEHERRGTSTGLRADRGSVTFGRLADALRRAGRPADAHTRQRLAEFAARERALELFRVRLDQEIRAGRPVRARGSAAKLAWAELDRFAAELTAELLGADAVSWPADDPDGGRWGTAMAVALSTGIAGGTDEIQRTLIAERVLGLPKGR
ncbi:acyl-CoA dehydrogenase family protein [Amycolatopsis sp. NPDC004079]|uniref:acyl-CoA dehydrogenase family protein n=1 Tax=Amycolatopsis sp. NPDC004079 TaxID=3154549 RepID=UPI0033B77406